MKDRPIALTEKINVSIQKKN